MTTSTADGDYILGTGDDEIARLGLQHMVWRSRAFDAWQRAGFTIGQKLLDIGCGPGYASVDLAELVGQSGQVLALDRSPRFLAALEATRSGRGLKQLTTRRLDLASASLPDAEADGAWCRWILAFLKHPRDLLFQIARALRAGGPLVVHEYFHYRTWRAMPRCPEVEEFVEIMMETWRADGGEPEVGLNLPVWLGELGFELKCVRPLIDIVCPTDLSWQWLKSFFRSGLGRLVDTGKLSRERAQKMAQAFTECERVPNALMITPGVVEIIAIKR